MLAIKMERCLFLTISFHLDICPASAFFIWKLKRVLKVFKKERKRRGSVYCLSDIVTESVGLDIQIRESFMLWQHWPLHCSV